MNRTWIPVAVVSLFIGYGASYFIKPSLPVPQERKNRELIGQVVLAQQETDGTVKETGLRVPYEFGASAPWVVVSPDKTKVVYASWENVHYVLYVADIDGSKVRKIAEQEVPEGSGGLNVQSIQWSQDGTRITYEESGATCKEGCDHPVQVLMHYSVDVSTGKKTLLSKETY